MELEPSLIPWELEDPPLFEPYWFEKIDLNRVRVWAYNRRWSTSVYVTVIYLLTVWAAKQWMHFRPPLQLRTPLLLWNGFLASLSITAVIRGFPEIYNILSGPNGFHRSLCIRDGLNPPAAFWGVVFMFSKVLHFGDTVFLVLRKKPITFLHCYHHAVMFWATFYSFSEAEPISRHAAALNYSIHFLMYSYYFLEGLNFKIPKAVKMFITGTEITIFFIGLYINAYSLSVILKGEACARSWNSIVLQFCVVTSFVFAFGAFFYNNYLASNNKCKTL